MDRLIQELTLYLQRGATAGNIMTTNVEIKYLTAPHDGRPGPTWDDFAERLRSVAAGQTDKRGWSLADTMDGVDEGGAAAAAPAIPAGAAGNTANTYRRIRLKRN